MSTVYKYCTPRGVAILENLELKITPNQFNDPFEFTPRMIWSNPLRRATSILRKKDNIRSVYKMLKAEERFKGSFQEFRAKTRVRLPEMARELAICIPLGAMDVLQRQEILEKSSKIHGILCLSQRRDSILMWGHYSDRHCGIVIGFDSACPVFRSKYPLTNVKYVQQRVAYDASWNEEDPGVHAFEEEVVFCKNADWSYEQEVRQLFTLSLLMQKPLDDGTLGYFLPLPPESLVSVTLGARCSNQTEQAVRLALQNPRLAHVKLDRASLHDSEFALRFT